MDNLLDGMDDLQTTPPEDYLEALIGEGGKFYDPDRNVALNKLARGKWESDVFIRHTNREKDQLRSDYMKLKDEYNASASLEELLDRHNRKDASISSDDTQAKENSQPAYDPKHVESLIENKLSLYEIQKKEDSNYNMVREKLKEKFGNNYQAVLKEQVEDLGLDIAFVNDLARKHPTVLFKTLGLDAQARTENFQSPPRSTRNDSFAPKNTVRDWNYYQGIRTKEPKVYYDPKTQVQMHKDAQEQGERFFPEYRA